MSSGAWLREEQADLAAEKILAAAGRVFVERGVSGAGMREIAESAGCSRGTLYRYFRNRGELHRAYVDHWGAKLAARVSAEIAVFEDPHERLVEGVARALRAVRSTPETAAWFAPGESSLAARTADRAVRMEESAAAFVGRLLGGDLGGDGTLRARWLVRIVVSFLTLPGKNETEERELLERFVAPALLRRTMRDEDEYRSTGQ